jgi:hypothetical protein
LIEEDSAGQFGIQRDREGMHPGDPETCKHNSAGIRAIADLQLDNERFPLPHTVLTPTGEWFDFYQDDRDERRDRIRELLLHYPNHCVMVVDYQF